MMKGGGLGLNLQEEDICSSLQDLHVNMNLERNSGLV